MFRLIIGIIYILTIILYGVILFKKQIKDNSTYLNFIILIAIFIFLVYKGYLF
jgi:hypothetical protein